MFLLYLTLITLVKGSGSCSSDDWCASNAF